MYAPPYPSFPEVFATYSFWMAMFNLAGLALTVVWWARSDQRMLRRDLVEPERFSVVEQKERLRRLRENYFYFEQLPLYVDRSPLRLAMHRSSAPSLGPVLIVAMLQSIPLISMFAAVLYTMHAVWHLFKFFERQSKKLTPEPIKRLLFNAWF